MRRCRNVDEVPVLGLTLSLLKKTTPIQNIHSTDMYTNSEFQKEKNSSVKKTITLKTEEKHFTINSL